MIPLHYFTGVSALFLASIAAFFSITGLGALYAAAFIPIVIMGSGIEFGKIVATFWLHRNFQTASNIWLFLLTIVVIGSMAVTSGGVYGFLTKGHIEQETPLADKNLRIERIDNQIQSERNAISRAQARVDQLDGVINTLIEFDKISGPDGARAVRDRQEPERKEMQDLINGSYTRIDVLNDQKLVFQQEVASTEAKLGPVKYLAALFNLPVDKSVQYFTLLIVILLDPFAIMLVIATSISYDRYESLKNSKVKNNGKIREIIKEVEKIVEVPVEKIVEKIVEIEKTPDVDSITEFLENEEVQNALVNDPKLLSSVELLIEKASNKKAETSPQPGSGWYNSRNPLKK